MKKNFIKKITKRGDALSTVVITIFLIIIALIMVPAFRGMQVDNTSATRALSNSHVNFVNEGLSDAGGGANYQLDTEDWSTTDATANQ